MFENFSSTITPSSLQAVRSSVSSLPDVHATTHTLMQLCEENRKLQVITTLSLSISLSLSLSPPYSPPLPVSRCS